MRQSGFITDWIEEGIQQGLQREVQQALQQGKQSLLVELLVAKFGELPQSVTEQIHRMTREEEVDQLGIRLLTAASLEEMGLDGGQNPSR